ncbi:MAG: branched-chain amino acid ABC transporter permease [Acidimicrobiales bacterium]|nr:branched-chain amino acid ABC transporter permease [Acidimicrobiales bacterium]
MTAAIRQRVRPRTAVDRFLTFLRFALTALVVFGLFAFLVQQFVGPDNPLTRFLNEDANRLDWDAFRGLLVSGLSQGSMYGLIALGYSMVYGVLGFINFAHGEVFMVGAMTGLITSNKLFEAGVWDDAFPVAILIAVLVSTICATLTAVLMERIAYRPLRGAPRLIPLITSIGVSFFIQNTSALLLGPGAKRYPLLPQWLRDDRGPTWLRIGGQKILVIVVAAAAMAALWYLVERTKTGKAMRAVAEDKEIASLMGIDVDRTIVTTFAIGGAMAGIAGILWGILFGSVTEFTGFLPGIKAFSAAVVGGIGNLGGAMAGGLTLGGSESLAPQLILEPLGVTGHTQLKDAVAFLVLIYVLLVRPTGLFGERLSAEDRA